MDEQKVLVTGGAGYIGSHACKALQQSGFIPVTFDNLATGWRDAVKFGPLEQGDLLNKGDIDRVFEKHSPVAVMHFAALSQVGESMQKPGLYWQNNVMGSLNLIQSAVDHGCMDFVFSSTCATYGDQDGVVLDEESMQQPINAYGASKRAVENILADYQTTYGLNK
jgi:UDP-glucose 4-epimerase